MSAEIPAMLPIVIRRLSGCLDQPARVPEKGDKANKSGFVPVNCVH